jgi:hypothetical protein
MTGLGGSVVTAANVVRHDDERLLVSKRSVMRVGMMIEEHTRNHSI